MTMFFRCDGCNAILENDSDRYFVIGNFDKDSKLDLCGSCKQEVEDYFNKPKPRRGMSR